MNTEPPDEYSSGPPSSSKRKRAESRESPLPQLSEEAYDPWTEEEHRRMDVALEQQIQAWHLDLDKLSMRDETARLVMALILEWMRKVQFETRVFLEFDTSEAIETVGEELCDLVRSRQFRKLRIHGGFYVVSK